LLSLDDGEDERSVDLHITAMKAQWVKGEKNRDWTLITDRMKRTFMARREMVVKAAKLVDLLANYPALQDQSQVS
jgi:hypothetical protein